MIRKLAGEYSSRGLRWKLARREHNIALFEQYMDGQLIAYEVAIIKVKENGFTGELYEAFPTNESFGKTAWSFGVLADKNTAYKKAIQKLNELRVKEIAIEYK